MKKLHHIEQDDFYNDAPLLTAERHGNMHKLAEERLMQLKAEKDRHVAEAREKFLRSEGLIERVYFNETTGVDVTGAWYDSDKKQYYRNVPITVSDEEYGILRKAVTQSKGEGQKETDHINTVSIFAIIILVIGILGAGILGDVLSAETAEYREFLVNRALYPDIYRTFYGTVKEYSWIVFFCGAVSSLILAALFYSLGAIMKRQDKILSALKG